MAAAPQSTEPTPKAQLLKLVTDSLRAGTLELPSLPDIAIDVRVAITQPELDINDLAKLIQQDPGLSAYLLKISHSVHYSRGNPARNLTAAIRRLGLNAARDLTASYALKALFLIQDTAVKSSMRDIWRRSVYTASLAHVMARHCGFDPDRALLAGLIQDIGALPLLANLKDFPSLTSEPSAIKELLNEFTGKISGLILHNWHFDEELILVGLNRENWMRDKNPTADLADLILIARYHTYLDERSHGKLPQLSRLPAFKKLHLQEMGPEQGLAFLSEAKQEISELRSALL
ncbi:HDOD domain-containing protein [uncultured Zhongshania sp.]|uniref:HDOD domain-containing protein n=1 Tax=uncultured Zhongshania sp. TaxID=1642288 RepID=UPI0030D6CFBB|tara:strand:- start:54073 stop:54942 length:870 start_codon:yes stop_codon:yes gene_type:complete